MLCPVGRDFGVSIQGLKSPFVRGANYGTIELGLGPHEQTSLKRQLARGGQPQARGAGAARRVKSSPSAQGCERFVKIGWGRGFEGALLSGARVGE